MKEPVIKLGSRVPSWMNGKKLSEIPSFFKENRQPFSTETAAESNQTQKNVPIEKADVKPMPVTKLTEINAQSTSNQIHSVPLTSNIPVKVEKIAPKLEPKPEPSKPVLIGNTKISIVPPTTTVNKNSNNILDSNANLAKVVHRPATINKSPNNFVDLNANIAPVAHSAQSLQQRFGLASQQIVGPDAAKQLQIQPPPQNAKKLTKRQLQAQKNARKALGLNAIDEVIDPSKQAEKEPKLDDDKAEDKMGVAETFADYKPAKLTFGEPHPDPVVETASLSSVEPNDITYQLSIPKKTIKQGKLSALQLESIVYASQAHQSILADGTRAGFLIGKF